jgi:hypothetical protein
MSFCFQIVAHKLLHYLLNNDPKIAILNDTENEMKSCLFL